MKTAIALILTVTLAGAAVAQDYLPLDPGNFWSYRNDAGLEELRIVVDQVPIFDGNPYAVVYTVSPQNQGLVNYWSTEPDGDVMLWGFYRGSWGYLYDPPIRMLDAPLNVGKSWATDTQVYILPDTIPDQLFVAEFTAYENPVLTVPAGEFPTFGIGPADPAAKAAIRGRYTLWGTVITDKETNANSWYSLGVGEVQYDTGRVYRLETYTDHPVSVETATWGAVKALYRGN